MHCVFLLKDYRGRLPGARELAALGFHVSTAAAGRAHATATAGAEPAPTEASALARAAEAVGQYGAQRPKDDDSGHGGNSGSGGDANT